MPRFYKDISPKKVIFVVLIFASICVALFSVGKPIFAPWQTSINLDMPTAMALDEDGLPAAVIDEDGTRLITLDKNQNVIATTSIVSDNNIDYINAIGCYEDDIYVSLVTYYDDKFTIQKEDVVKYNKALSNSSVIYTHSHDDETVDVPCIKRFEVSHAGIYCVVASGTNSEMFQTVSLNGEVSVTKNLETGMPRSEITMSDYNGKSNVFVAATPDKHIYWSSDEGKSFNTVINDDFGMLQTLCVTDNGDVYFARYYDSNVYCYHDQKIYKCLGTYDAKFIISDDDIYIVNSEQDCISKFNEDAVSLAFSSSANSNECDLLSAKETDISSFGRSLYFVLINLL